MNITFEFYLLKVYMKEYIDRGNPVLLDHQINLYKKHGYIECGHNWKNFPTFEQWKQIWYG